MAHGVNEMLSHEAGSPTGAKQQQQHTHHQSSSSSSSSSNLRKSVGVMGSRRIFAPAFKLKVLNSYRHDLDCRGNQRATARKYNIHRRQIQKWLQCEDSLRSCCAASVVADSSSSSSSGGGGGGGGSGNTSTGSSPSPDSTQQHQPAAATLNPSRARLHGDEQQQQPPPPPPLAPTQQQQQQQQQQQPPPQPSAAATGYRFLPQHYDYPQLIYQPPPPPAAVAAVQQYPYAAFQPPVVHHRYTPDEAMMIGEIKREPASPDSATTTHLKKERLDDEVCNLSSFSSGISDVSSSPAPSHLESLPPSPRESTHSSGSDSEADSSSGGLQHHHHRHSINTSSAVDLARRRSFSLRFKLRVLDAFHSDKICKKNQRATARKFNINRRQVQKWLSQERDLRDPTQHRGANRQRLGSHSPAMAHEDSSKWLNLKREHSPMMMTTTTTTTTMSCIEENNAPVDLRTGGIEYSNYCEMSPNSYVDTALTPPYSQPGCTLSCCSQEQPTYYCYSPTSSSSQQHQLSSSSQEQPLCLVKPKVEPVSSTVPTPPAPTPPKKDAILFKPYLDNPVSKPAPPSPSSNNNNSHEICNLNDLALDVSFRPQHHYVQQQPYQLEVQRARSAFVRYPAYLQ